MKTLRSVGKWLWTGMLDLLFPPKCPFCSKLLEKPRALVCDDCQRTLPWLEGKSGERKVQFVSLCVSPLAYRNQVRESVHRFKFSGRQWYAKVYGQLLAQCVQDHLTDRYDLVTWVPVSSKRRRERGYDQAFLLARSAAEHLGTVLTPTLRKVRNNPAQSGLQSASARRANVMGVYELLDPERVRDRRILLIDDVVTTGETLSECARMLRSAGAADVVCAALAKAGGGIRCENGETEPEKSSLFRGNNS